VRGRRLIITINDKNISDFDALMSVTAVVQGGRISDEGKAYCYCSSWENGDVVYAEQLESGTDKFFVTNNKKDEEKS
jgi:hypothetical protein